MGDNLRCAFKQQRGVEETSVKQLVSGGISVGFISFGRVSLLHPQHSVFHCLNFIRLSSQLRGGERGIRLDPGPALISAAVNCKAFFIGV